MHLRYLWYIAATVLRRGLEKILLYFLLHQWWHGWSGFFFLWQMYILYKPYSANSSFFNTQLMNVSSCCCSLILTSSLVCIWSTFIQSFPHLLLTFMSYPVGQNNHLQLGAEVIIVLLDGRHWVVDVFFTLLEELQPLTLITITLQKIPRHCFSCVNMYFVFSF